MSLYTIVFFDRPGRPPCDSALRRLPDNRICGIRAPEDRRMRAEARLEERWDRSRAASKNVSRIILLNSLGPDRVVRPVVRIETPLRLASARQNET